MKTNGGTTNALPTATHSGADIRSKGEQLRAVFEHAGVGIAIAALDGRFLETNPRFCDILDLSHEELSERTFLGVTHPDDVETTRRHSEDLLSNRLSTYSLEKRYLRRDGSAVWCNTSVTLLRDEHGAPTQFIGFVEDISHRKEVEEARDHLAAVVQQSDDAIITKTLDGTITTWNPGAERIYGYSASEVIGKPVTILIPPGQEDEEPALLARLRRGERIDHHETVRRRKDGTLIDVSLTVSPLKDSSGRIVGAAKIARDITRQKRVEEALRTQTQILREMDQRKDEFLATLSHELRNPLAPIKQAAILSSMPETTEDQKRWANAVIRRQVQHMSLLLDDLLDISRITRGTLELRVAMTDLSTVIDGAVETSRPLIEIKRHRFEVDLPSEPIRFAADSLRLAQVLSNLLTNAAKYTDAGGHIRLVASADDRNVILRVEDNGIGIPADAITQVFQMFSQVRSARDRSEGGLGIGLSLAKGLIELHGGRLDVESRGLGHGSTFIVTLPRRSVSAPRADTHAGQADSMHKKHRVLIADDNQDAAESLAMLMRLDGHEATVVHDGPSALEAIRSDSPDVAVLDIGMPGMNGYEVAQVVRRTMSSSAPTLVAVTGWGAQGDVDRAVAAGFDYHFTKPVEPAKLMALLAD